MHRNQITAIIGPSGCGKTTLLRSFNRMNELVPGTRVEGKLFFEGQDLYDASVDPVEVRYRIGMVFQKANPFPKSIYENIAWAARIHGYRGNYDELVESCLRQAALWDEVKDKLRPVRPGAVRRTAATAVHCPGAGRPAGGDPDG